MEPNIDAGLRRYRYILSGGFGLILLVVISINILLLGSYGETLNEFEETVQEHNLKVELATNAEISAHFRGELQQLMVLIDDPFHRDEVFLQFNQIGYEVNVAREALRELATSDDELALIKQQDDVIQLMSENHRVINDLLMEEKRDEAARIIVEAYGDGRLHVLFSTLQSMRDMQKQLSEKHLNNSRKKLDISARFSAGALLIVLVASILIIVTFIRYAGRESSVLGQMVTRLNESHKRYEYLALHDNLTKLPNRTNFFSYADKMQNRSRPDGVSLYLLFVDIDGFKSVNDKLGHETGNELLIQIAQRLQNTLSEKDFLARLGGDEFIIMTEMSKPGVTALSTKVVKAICRPFVLDAGDARVGTSIGIADTTDANNVDEQVHRADMAMYQAKRDGGCCYRFANECIPDQLSGRTASHSREVERSDG